MVDIEYPYKGEDGRWYKPCPRCNEEQSYLADLLIEQDFKCALTGWDIEAMKVQVNTASLDRIDSSKGYIEENVQWVHKMVNMSKQSYSQEEFIEMCKAVSSKIKW
jgi:hypothetical protein